MIQVLARSAGSTAAYEVYQMIFYTINPPPPPPATGVTLTMDKNSPQVQGAVITFTAAATGGSGKYEYYFTYRNPNTGLWTAAQPYSSNPSWTWNTTGIDTGTYTIEVWARSARSTAAYEAYQRIYYTIGLVSR
jgi:hypothetical protein